MTKQTIENEDIIVLFNDVLQWFLELAVLHMAGQLGSIKI